jgi:hypothetical protein
MQRRLLSSTIIAATVATLVCLPMPGKGDEITPPPDSSKPNTAPTATRGGSNCSSQENPLLAIAPNQTSLTTTADYPTLLFYIPETIAKEAEFVMIDGEGNFVYQSILTLPEEPGIIRLNLSPEEASPLAETGNPYRWEFALICNESDRSADVLVGGELQRVEASAEIENKLANGSDRFSVFQEAGLEYDAIAALEELRRENPEDSKIQILWESWLRENGLEDLVEKPSLGNR